MKVDKKKVAHEVQKTKDNIAKGGADLNKQLSKFDTKHLIIIASVAVAAVLAVVITIVAVNSNSGPKVPEITKTEEKEEEKKLIVPNVMGLDHANAKKVLEDAGFTVTEIEADAGPMLKGAGYGRDVNKGNVFRVNNVYYSGYSDTYDQPKVEGNKVTIYYAKDNFKYESSSSSSSSSSNNSSSSSSTNSSSSSSSNTGSSSSSSTSSSTNSLCTSTYKQDLEAAKTAYELAQSSYESMKKMGMSASDLKTYEASMDMAKASLDAAQKIYDTYCK